MPNLTRCLFLTILILCLLAPAEENPGAAEAPNDCVKCHSFLGGDLAKPVSEWTGSIHQNNGVACDACHGGNPGLQIGDLQKQSPDQLKAWAKRAMYAASNFVGAPSGQAQFDLCATCHPDSVKTYSGSIMGQAYLARKGGPSCARCHGAHRNEIPPVPQSCQACHKDTTGYDKIPVMGITEATVRNLAQIRIQIRAAGVSGKPLFRGHFESYMTAAVTWGMVLLLLGVAVGLYRVLERRKHP